MRAIRRYARRQKLFLIVISVGLAPAVVSFTLFPLIYSIMSVPLQQLFDISFWQREISNGALALRVTSLLLTYQLAQSIIRFVPRRRELIAARESRGLSHDDVADFTTSVTTEERQLWRQNDLLLLAFFQFSFYLITLTALWACSIVGINTVVTALASWALLFIVDDWSVIADYCHQFDSLPMAAHAAKVLCIDVILLLAVPAALYPAHLGIVWVAICLTLFVSSLLVAMFFWRARHFQAQDA
ncbi:hypothetical protein [Zoogloea sp.]|uniref:hypothetical protein n=1 Tax=Zoogloea sp. TaxID=49181 RepID=UPI0031FC49FE